MSDAHRRTLSDRWRMLIGASDPLHAPRSLEQTSPGVEPGGMDEGRTDDRQSNGGRGGYPRRDWEEKREQNFGHRGRMRQRLLEGGADGFLDYELLEYVLGLAIPRRDTKQLAKRLIAEFGSFSSVISAQPAELARVPGLGEHSISAIKFVHAASVRLLKEAIVNRPVLDSWTAVIDYLHSDMAHGLTERFRVLFLNSRNILIRDEVLFEGTINQAPVYTREVIKRALELGAAAVILVHNHPSGDPKPSRDDIELTKEIVEVGRHLELAVYDHVIIGRSGHSSLKSMGLF
jgi:DNA repair protein RadC